MEESDSVAGLEQLTQAEHLRSRGVRPRGGGGALGAPAVAALMVEVERRGWVGR